MHAIGTLGDAPTAAIAVIAILLGLLFAARGPRDKRAGAGAQAPAGPSLLSVPVPSVTPPDVEPGFVGPEGMIVGHGTIRLGGPRLHAGAVHAEPETPSWAAPAQEPAGAPAAAPVVDAEPAAPAEPAPSGEPEAAFPGQPEAVEPAGAEAGPEPSTRSRRGGATCRTRRTRSVTARSSSAESPPASRPRTDLRKHTDPARRRVVTGRAGSS